MAAPIDPATLLQQLEALEAPTTASLWPLAPAYWLIILASFVLAVSIFLLIKWRQSRTTQRQFWYYFNENVSTADHPWQQILLLWRWLYQQKTGQASPATPEFCLWLQQHSKQLAEIPNLHELIDSLYRPQAESVVFELKELKLMSKELLNA